MSPSERWVPRRLCNDGPLPAQYGSLHPLLSAVLYARRIETPADILAFLGTARDESDPFALPDMNAAVERVARAIANHERIVVFGDFDADGVTSTALLVSALASVGARISAYIPDRFVEGYGLNREALAKIRGEGADLLLTVDCGIRSPSEVSFAQALGLDVILTDHHSVPAALPPALAVINPKRVDSVYPYRDLAGVGVTYRLVQALSAHCWAEWGLTLYPDDWLDLVALGTVADIVPLTGENRALVQQGLQRLRRATRPGVAALIEAARASADTVTSQDIAFRLAPRLNATGRLEHANLAYALLTCHDFEEARRLAADLERLNAERQGMLAEQVAQAEAEVDLASLPLFVAGPGYHEGIVGLVASRLAEHHHLPTLVMRTGAETTRGSARSPALRARTLSSLLEAPAGDEEFSITRALEACADLLVRYGGHARAAGFTIETDKLCEFRERLEAYCAAMLDPASLEREHVFDALASLGEVNADAVRALQRMEPFGEANPPPTFVSLGSEIVSLVPIGNERQHVRLRVRQNGCELEAIAFRQGRIADTFALGERIDLLYRPEINTWQGQERLQLVVISSRRHEGSAAP